MTPKVPNVVLSNGVEMPIIGLGTWQVEDEQTVKTSVNTALEIGYRHIDTAALYKNEESIGEAIQESGIARKEIFLTSKMWNSDHGYDNALRAFDMSLKKLKSDYLDLYLIHWPMPLNSESWRAFERIYHEGRAKAIGVSNFHVHHLQDLMAHCEIKPMVNQVEFHPYLVQQPLVDFCKANKIQFEAWRPLMQGEVFNIPLLHQLAEKYQRTIAQIVLRWNIQMGVVTIPKSINYDRMKSNFQIFDFELEAVDVLNINALDKNMRLGADPDNFEF
jgi:diketogulonate reductase-like aldo/keto reductase